MIRTLIVDDEKPARMRIRSLLEEISDIDILGESTNGAEAIKMVIELKPQLILLDIQLKDMDGFEVLDRISGSFDGQIIFITAYNDFAIKAFDHHALDYLLKPFKKDRFFRSIERAQASIKSNDKLPIEQILEFISSKSDAQNNILKIKEGKKTHRIDLSAVTHFKADGYYVNVITKDSKRIVRVTLKEFEQKLPEGYVRVNRSIIVNKNKIEWVKQLKNSVEIQLVTGENFVVSKVINALI